MIEPNHRFVDRCHTPACQFGRPFEQQNRYTEHACRGNLAVGSGSATVLGDDDVDGMATQQRTFGLLAERSTPLNVVSMRYRKSRFDRIHAANEVAVLGGLGKAVDLLTPEREKRVKWLRPQSANRVGRALHLGPSVTRNLTPRRATQSKQGRVGLRGCADRMSGDRRSVGMGRIDQRADAVLAQIVRKTIDAAEAAPSHRYRLNQRCRRASGERQGRRDVVPVRELQGKLSCLRSATENQDMSGHATH